MRKHLVHDGVKYVTSSGRRYVLFRLDGRGEPYIVRRSDNVDTLRKVKRFGGVLVDFNHPDGPRVI